MIRFLARHGLVRIIGGRAVPVLLVWDLVVLADRVRRIPIVDRGLRRGAGTASRRLRSAAMDPSWPARTVRERRSARHRRDRDG